MSSREMEPPTWDAAGILPQSKQNETDGAGKLQYSWFSDISSTFLFGAVIFYVAGWSYVYGYYLAFGISVSNLGLEIHEVMIYGGRGLSRRLLMTVLAGTAFALLVVCQLVAGRTFRETWRRRPRFLAMPAASWLVHLMGFCLIIALLEHISVFAVHQGISDASQDMQKSHTTLSQIELSIKAESAKDLPKTLFTSPYDETLRGHLITHGKSGYYVLPRLLNFELKGSAVQDIGSIEVDFVPDSAVAAAVIMTQSSQRDIQ